MLLNNYKSQLQLNDLLDFSDRLNIETDNVDNVILLGFSKKVQV